MKALILSAGEGTRLRPLTLSRPKPMLPLAGRPLLEHLVAYLRYHGIRDIAINLHYLPQVITAHFGDGERFGVRITYSYEERLLGSAGAAKRLEPYFEGRPFVVLYGDVLTDTPLDPLLAQHTTCRAALTMALYRVPDPARAGIVELDGTGRVVRFVEKPAPDQIFSDLANAGIYVVSPEVLRLVPPEEPYDFGHDLIPRLLATGMPVYGWEATGYVLDIGDPQRYAQAEQDLCSGRCRSFAE
jgi:NDP-sugar pyrophosphorylase family protein